MHVVMVYDVNKKRVKKALKICRKYLFHVQKSVFEGNITEAQLNRLKNELSKVMDSQADSVIIYKLESVKYVKKEQLGVVEENTNIV